MESPDIEATLTALRKKRKQIDEQINLLENAQKVIAEYSINATLGVAKIVGATPPAPPGPSENDDEEPDDEEAGDQGSDGESNSQPDVVAKSPTGDVVVEVKTGARHIPGVLRRSGNWKRALEFIFQDGKPHTAAEVTEMLRENHFPQVKRDTIGHYLLRVAGRGPLTKLEKGRYIDSRLFRLQQSSKETSSTA